MLNLCPSINEDFCSRSRRAKKITTDIYLIFRGLFFKQNADIGQKGHLWMDTNLFVPENVLFFISLCLRELEENNIRISCRTFVRIQGVIAGA